MIINISLCLSDIPKNKIKQSENGKKYLNITCSSRKEQDNFGNTHTVFISQTKEERERGAETVFIGSGKEFVNKPVTSEIIEKLPAMQDEDNDLPF